MTQGNPNQTRTAASDVSTTNRFAHRPRPKDPPAARRLISLCRNVLQPVPTMHMISHIPLSLDQDLVQLWDFSKFLVHSAKLPAYFGDKAPCLPYHWAALDLTF